MCREQPNSVTKDTIIVPNRFQPVDLQLLNTASGQLRTTKLRD